MTDEKRLVKVPQNLILEDRRILNMSGVSDVDSFDDRVIIVFTELGELTVRGNDLHINKLSVETGELQLEGNISSLSYADEQPKSSGFFSKVFR
ncbi:MAG: sporulation protein YabP [Clostridiales bacterium]|nr:sporulation protein YabP [Clostridiales bacterium]